MLHLTIVHLEFTASFMDVHAMHDNSIIILHHLISDAELYSAGTNLQNILR